MEYKINALRYVSRFTLHVLLSPAMAKSKIANLKSKFYNS